MTDLFDWLIEQITADEEVIRRNLGHSGIGREYRRVGASKQGLSADVEAEAADDYLVRFTPPRLLAECDAKRQLVELHVSEDCWCGDDPTEMMPRPATGRPCTHLRLLALPYADRPGYREEWRQ